MIISREINEKITPWLKTEKIIIIKGSRQTGKTTLLNSIKENLEKKGELTFYISAEQRYAKNILLSPDHLIDSIKEKYDLEKEFVFIFIDEFQYIKKAGLFLKELFDRYKKNIQLIVSGSSSLEISKNTEFLTGRKIEFTLQPFNFTEFLLSKNVNFNTQKFNLNELRKNFKKIKIFYDLHKEFLENALQEYIIYGGYPESAIEKDKEKKKIILNDIITTYIEKDIATFQDIENLSAYEKLIRLCSSQTSNLLNKNKLSNDLEISAPTVKKYLKILEGTYILKLLNPYSTNVRKQLTKMPKIYLEDLGVRSTILNDFYIPEENLGHLVETFIYIHLPHEFYVKKYFYRTLGGLEVDFLIEGPDLKAAIEVKYRPKIDKTPISLERFASENKHFQKIVATKNQLEVHKDTFFIPTVLFPFLKLS
ncbi:MAG: hypothetical protein UR28_C0004G0010 [Candidatus Peregrinibacteria bacterium GW2011_GWF2_33_10]|nr:MAG: hypothetical protein UR28_C0004G0010 [Candidatus Peregrinibacteria bacterium GW2011_GWF2_33_10]OGJ44127.1 MAG: hypothetical protein A2263_01755 [Candidatus Peregrinibacteria bacterium RIFOXYA2_FULL_33_21]